MPRPTPFDYDPSVLLAVDVAQDEGVEGARVVDLSYAVPRTTRVDAFLIRPIEQGRFPLVLYQHGSGGSRGDLFFEAVEVVKRGGAALLIDAPLAESLRGSVMGNVVAWRRALDLVQERDDLDVQRVAFVGLSYGAAIGGLLAAAEPRIDAFVLAWGRRACAATRWATSRPSAGSAASMPRRCSSRPGAGTR